MLLKRAQLAKDLDCYIICLAFLLINNFYFSFQFFKNKIASLKKKIDAIVKPTTHLQNLVLNKAINFSCADFFVKRFFCKDYFCKEVLPSLKLWVIAKAIEPYCTKTRVFGPNVSK